MHETKGNQSPRTSPPDASHGVVSASRFIPSRRTSWVLFVLLGLFLAQGLACGKGKGKDGEPSPGGGLGPPPAGVGGFPQAPSCEAAVCAEIRATRISGIAPLGVFFDGTMRSDQGAPFHDRHYEWQFGDEKGQTWRHSGADKNTATGAIAAHVFENPGTYEVRLTVTNSSGDTATDTLSIEVLGEEAWASTRCYADIQGNGGDFTGCPLDEDGDGTCDAEGCVDTNDLVAAVDGYLVKSGRLLFRRGDTFVTGNDADIRVRDEGPGLVGAFGSEDAAPILHLQNPDGRILSIMEGATDWRLQDLHLRGVGSSPLGIAASDALITNVVADELHNCLSIDAHDGTFPQGVVVADFDCKNLQSESGLAWQYWILAQRSALLGISIDDGRTTEGNLRIMHATQLVVQHSFLSRPADKKQSISIRSCDSLGGQATAGCGAHLPTRELIFSDNRIFARTPQVIDFKAEGPHQDIIFERNVLSYVDGFHELFAQFFVMHTGERISVRNNILEQSGGLGTVIAKGSVSPLWVYGNTVLTRVSGRTLLCDVDVDSPEGECANNLLISDGEAPEIATDSLDGGGNLRSGADFADAILLGGEDGQVSTPLDPNDFRPQADSVAVGASVEVQGFNAVDFFRSRRVPVGANVGAIE